MDALTDCSMDMAFAAILQSCAADIVQHHLQASLVCLTWGILLVFLEVKTCFVCCKSISVEYAAWNCQQRCVFAR